jgi:hypothetical protein
VTTENLAVEYQAFLVRLWRDSAQAPWRASLAHVATGEVVKFSSPQMLWSYVEQLLEAQPEEPNTAGLD